MKFSPDFPHELLWFGLALLKAILLSCACGFGFYKVFTSFYKAWKANNKLKMWICLSVGCFVLYVLLIGIE